MSAKTNQFDSEGFDLGASSEGGDDGAIYEIGGGVTIPDNQQQQQQPTETKESIIGSSSHPTDESERLKAIGNDHFKRGNHLDAYDYYTDAIEACPSGEGIGPTGEELLRMRDEFDEANREKMMERQRKEMERRRSRNDNGNSNDDGDVTKEEKEGGEDDDERRRPAVPTFSPPRHLYGPKLAVYHANRAATLLHLGRDGEAIEDCDVSLLFNPTYVKAYLRRSTARERTDDTEEALADAKRAFELDPSNNAARKNVARLQRIENERMEKLKEETMGKLKDLGNSLLGNFGLSLDNFNAVQDPKTGGYSISFNQ
mmetsp:Transcript_14297/g.25532  ORF Transcript_14297/g.25532 Transcript_14297/m.25532 type:complete len:314 (+) Transcript_14297:80-1021(+)|eukprot:CAMPEP_0196151100 /NCGR_PEP_ID=MMETSP0910-20130528/33034_1 /TAXON_ID=49265 /ORGANISM="Thalassiosira rotula, Strain GSO102" /LENGTH=313 /DNA_ID=CAMNT_0041414393 /DNA_START=4 /DNA_END=945 /DNA_ORIENTATION=+